MGYDFKNDREKVETITFKKKQVERLFMLVGGTGILVGFAIYGNFFASCLP